MNSTIRFQTIILILICSALIGVTGALAQFQQTIVVAPIPGNNFASGQVLLSAVATTSNASWGHRYLIKVEPGVYDLGTTPLAMRPHVDLEGSGRDRTFIRGTGMDSDEVSQFGLTRGTILGADNSEVRDVTVHATGQQVAIAIYNGSVSPRLRNVKVVAKEAVSCWGVRNLGLGVTTFVKIDGLQARINCSSFNSGISSLKSSRPSIEDVKITSWGASETNNLGLSIDANSYPVLLRDIQIEAGVDGAPGVGIRFPDNATVSSGFLEVLDARIESHGGVGILADVGLYINLAVRDSAIRNSRIGVDVDGKVIIEGSVIEGTEATVLAFGSSRVATTRLAGGPSVVTTCAGVYDETFTFFPATCP